MKISSNVMLLMDLKVRTIFSASGCESRYYQLAPNWGIKIYHSPSEVPYNKRTRGFETIEACVNSLEWKEVLRQAELMNYFAQKRRVPKVEEMLLVQDELGLYYAALKMEHIDYSAIWHSTKDERIQKIRWQARERFMHKLHMRDKNYVYHDTHEDNFVFNTKLRRFMIIDFGSVMAREMRFPI